MEFAEILEACRRIGNNPEDIRNRVRREIVRELGELFRAGKLNEKQHDRCLNAAFGQLPPSDQFPVFGIKFPGEEKK